MSDDANKKLRNPDMSSEALARRLREVSDLFDFGMALRSARRLGKLNDLRAERAKTRPADPEAEEEG